MLHANLARGARKSVAAALNASRLWYYHFSGSLFTLPGRCADFTSLFTTLISLAQQYFRVMVRWRLGERPWLREGTILRSEPGVGFRANGGGGGNRTRVPGKQTSRDYMLSPERVFCRAMASELESRGLVRMEFSRPTARGLRLQPCLLWRSSGVAGVHRRTSRHIRPRELIVR